MLSIFQPIGVVLCSAIAFGFIPTMSCSPNFSEANPLPSCITASDGEPCCGRSNNMGWRYLLFTLGAITLAVFFVRFVLFNFRESPKFLIYNGQDAEAVRVVQHIAKTNGRMCELRVEDFEALSGGATGSDNSYRTETMTGGINTFKRVRPSRIKFRAGFERYGLLFSNFTMARLTVLVWLTYIMDFWGFTVAGKTHTSLHLDQAHTKKKKKKKKRDASTNTFSPFSSLGFYLPRILALKNGSASESLAFTYASYIYTYAPGILGVLLGASLSRLPHLGRKWTMVLSSALMGASILLFATVDTVAKRLGLFTLEYFFQSMFNAVLYGWTPEAFPAPVRGTACGVASFWGRLFGIVSPLVAQSVYGGDGGGNGVLFLAGGVTLGCVVSTALLPAKQLESVDGKS